ncbi:MAG: hypothetical protein LKG11_00840 [Bacilli bacterium]|jgi:hypothetical protein|nr:hypothetical protein [Bacilli bacterium]
MQDSDSIAAKLRQLLLQYGLEIVYAEGQVKFFDEQRRLQSSMNGRNHEKAAINAKVNREAYKTYACNLKSAKERVEVAIQTVTGVYDDVRKKIWFMYFIQQKPYAEIAADTLYNERTLKRVVASMKVDIAEKLEASEEPKHAGEKGNKQNA